MRSRLMTAAAAALPALMFAVASGPVATAAPHGPASPAAAASVRKACDAAPARGRAQCLALLRTAANGAPLTRRAASPSDPPPGFGPAQLQDAYQLAAAAAARGGGQTVAVVDAYDDPSAEADLTAYRAEYGLPPCTTGNGCFRKINQDGDAAPLPPPDVGWAIEESLDLDMVSAVCPKCHILLAEADDNLDISLAATVATAAKLGATQISNSYGEPEYPGETRLAPFYNQPGISVTAASGDFGYRFGVSWPAASADVTAVGGTSLYRASGSRGWAETAWSMSGSGCSSQIPKPAWQHDTACTHRTSSDVAAVADPLTAVAAYDTFGLPGWVQVGGTSVASPIVASVYALTGDAGSSPGGSYFYSHQKNLFDITTGSDGTCYPAYLCTAGTGYDGPTGLGTPDVTGTSASTPSCVDGWSSVPSPDHSQLPATTRAPNLVSSVNGVAALGRADVWTAGYDYQVTDSQGEPGFVTDIEHWNGSGWTRSPSPNPAFPWGFPDNTLNSVVFDNAKDGWAVGTFQTNGTFEPLVEHWNGSSWTISAALSPIDTSGQYPAANFGDAISAVSPTDVWLVGETLYPDPSAPPKPFVEHWDGTQWRFVSLPDLPDQTLFRGLHASSANDVWAVGRSIQDHIKPVIIHWDGSRWSVTPTPDVSFGILHGVGGASPDDVWAVGVGAAGTGSQQLVEHWDGHAWTVVPNGSSAVVSPDTELLSVSATSASDAWAAGGRHLEQPGDVNLVQHWDGSAWHVIHAPQPQYPEGLTGVSASSPGNAWAVGDQEEWYSYVPNNPVTGRTYVIRNGCRNG